ncbi:MAG: hypothetical protein PUI29_10840 [Aeromonadales bacterium]|nr:hypothetical protein [Aeromonadales bacterium]MDY2891516.1 hypothetical protein [Succinivibrio sp.]
MKKSFSSQGVKKRRQLLYPIDRVRHGSRNWRRRKWQNRSFAPQGAGSKEKKKSILFSIYSSMTFDIRVLDLAERLKTSFRSIIRSLLFVYQARGQFVGKPFEKGKLSTIYKIYPF